MCAIFNLIIIHASISTEKCTSCSRNMNFRFLINPMMHFSLVIQIHCVDVKQCGSWSAGFIRSQLIWIKTKGSKEFWKSNAHSMLIRLNMVYIKTAIFELFFFQRKTFHVQWSDKRGTDQPVSMSNKIIKQAAWQLKCNNLWSIKKCTIFNLIIYMLL